MAYVLEDTEKRLTAFRKAEKKYQLHYEQILKPRKDGKLRGCGHKVKETDLSALLDPVDPKQDKLSRIDLAGDANLYCAPSHPGFCIIKDALSPGEQSQLISDCLQIFPNGPATTNHTSQHGLLQDLWKGAKANQLWKGRNGCQLHTESNDAKHGRTSECSVSTSHPIMSNDLVRNGNGEGQPQDPGFGDPNFATTIGSNNQDFGSWQDANAMDHSDGSAVPGKHLLQKLRWASLGPNFDWTARAYLYNKPHRPLTQQLIDLALQHTKDAEEAGVYTSHATIGQAAFAFDAALVNYYAAGDCLGGHSDDVETDLSKPIVSISLGCDAVFLLGGLTRDEEPLAIRVQSGDIVILGGLARRCYHGVPRIFHDRPLNRDAQNLLQPEQATFMEGRRINISIRDTR